MRTFLSLLCFLCAPPLHCAFEGTCLRKEPSPGLLVLSPGSVLVLTCSGQVTVDGVKVRNGSNSGKRDGSHGTTQTTLKTTRKTQVWTKSERRSGAVSHGPSRDPGNTNRSPRHGVTHVVHPTSSDALKGDDADAEEEEEGEEETYGGSRVTRGLRRQWKWTRRTTNGKGDKDVTFTSEAELSLSSVKLADSGTYTCFYRGTEMHMFKVIVADPPETPSITCYKRSHSGKIRCESTPQERANVRPSCHLLSKRPTEQLRSSPCSYSSRTSRCWCILEHKEEDRRTSHYAFMCVTNIKGNVTSNVVTFTPMGILKPDPPSNVTAWQVEGQETRVKVTWNLPTSWKHHSHFYKLSFELKYRPLVSSFQSEQLLKMKDQFSDTITDVLPGVDYLIQLRARDEYDGVWSDWSAAVCARSWTAPTATLAPDYVDLEGSGTDSIMTDVAPTLTAVSSDPTDESTHFLWISALLAYLSVIFAVYVFSYRDRFLSNLQSAVFGGCSGDSPQPMPSAPPAAEGQALVTLDPQSHQDRPGEEEENEEQRLNESNKTMHFNNVSYFFLQQ